MGASSAKRAARAQEAALIEQTKQMQAQAQEAARQTAASAANAAARDAASQKVEADTLANKPEDVEVDLAPTDTSLTRKRSRFQTTDAGVNSIRI